MTNWVGILAFCSIVAITGAGVDVHADKLEGEDYLTDLEMDVVHEINLARTHPQKYADYVDRWIPYYDKKLRRLPGRSPVLTREGVPALREAIRFLRSAEPIHPLKPYRGMSYGARDHVLDMGPSGAIGHRGYDDSESGDRVNRYGRWLRRVGENIVYGGEVPRELVMRLIIDDGVPGRGHRKNIFDPDYYVVGVAFGYHDTYETMCVITFAADYIE